jgi:membrane protease YdiL (CAAX protease family)
MKLQKTHHRLLIFLLLALALTCIISPWMAVGADWFAARWPALLEERVPFARVFNRAFMIAAILLFIAGHRYLIPTEIKPLLTVAPATAGRGLVTGCSLGLVSMALLLVAMTAADIYSPFFRLSLERSLSRIASAVASGVFVSFMEEVFFRGLLFLGLMQHGLPLRAYVLANLFYSALHFVKPGEDYFLDGLELLAGFRHLFTTFHPFFEPATILPGLIGLFLIGVVLSYALVRTGNLYLSIGIHAGWIIGLKTIRVFGEYARQDLGWLFGVADPKIVSGVAAWIGVVLVGVAIAGLTRPGSLLAVGRILHQRHELSR